MPHSEQRPGQNGDRRPYWPVHPSHQNRGQAPGQQRQTRDLTHGQDARGQRRYFSSRPPIEGPGQADPNEVLENVLGEVFKIIDYKVFIFCKIVNKSGDWDYITAKYYPMDQRNIGAKVRIKDLKIGTMVYVSLHYSDFKRMWEATSLKVEMHKPAGYEAATSRSSGSSREQKQATEVVAENPIATKMSADQTPTSSNRQPPRPEEKKKQVPAIEQSKSGPARESSRRNNDKTDTSRFYFWKPFPLSGRRQSEQGSLNPKSEIFIPRVAQPRATSPVKPVVKRYAPEMVYNLPATLKSGPNPRLEFLDERKTIKIGMTEVLKVDFRRFGESYEKKLVLEEVEGRQSDLPVYIDASKIDLTWTLKQVHLPSNFLTKTEAPTFVKPILDALVDDAIAVQNDSARKVKPEKGEGNPKASGNQSDDPNADTVPALDEVSAVRRDFMDQGPKDSTPCDDLAKFMPELESGLKPVADQLQPTLNCKDQLLDLVADTDNLLEAVARGGSEVVVQSLEMDFPLDEDVFCEVPILEPAIMDVSVASEIVKRESAEEPGVMDVTRTVCGQTDPIDLVVHESATNTDSIGGPEAQAVDDSLADPENPNPANVVVNQTGQDAGASPVGLEIIDVDVLKNFLHYVASSENPKALLEAFMKSKE